MAVFFNIDNLEAYSKNNPKNLIRNLRDLVYKKALMPKKLIGPSFLLNPKPIVSNKPPADILFVYQYIKLAALRDYSTYKQYGFTGIDLSLYPDILLNTIVNNPLISIQNNNLIFLYENIKEQSNGN